MSIVKLTNKHNDMLKPIFSHSKYMGLETSQEHNDMLYDRFTNTYTFGLNNFHSYGYIQDNEIKALISFYESDEEPAWYYTLYRSMGDNKLLSQVLDHVIEHNENKGRLKFYTLTHTRHTRLLRRFHWSKYNDERYGYFNECLIPAKHKSIYTNHWELLFKRFLETNRYSRIVWWIWS